MALEYQYGIYNPGQYPADTQAAWDAMVTDGWQVHTAMPNYSEVCIFWQRELSGKRPGAGRGAPEGEKGDGA